MMVKICGITNREDAMAAIEGGAAAVGFNFYRDSPRYVRPEQAAQMISGLPDTIWKVGVFVDESPEVIRRIAALVRLDVAQLHGSESPAEYPAGMRVWKAIRVRPGETPQLDCPAEAVLLDGPASGQSFDWARIRHGTYRLIVAGGLDASNVRQAIHQMQPWGVDACSKLERSPGRKDHFKMAEFLKAAREAAA